MGASRLHPSELQGLGLQDPSAPIPSTPMMEKPSLRPEVAILQQLYTSVGY